MDLTFAYFAPETLLPATSIIATALGFIMLVGRGSYRLALRALKLSPSRPSAIADTSTPHYNHVHASENEDVHSSSPVLSVNAAD